MVTISLSEVDANLLYKRMNDARLAAELKLYNLESSLPECSWKLDQARLEVTHLNNVCDELLRALGGRSMTQSLEY